jgi:hypothetical protein
MYGCKGTVIGQCSELCNEGQSVSAVMMWPLLDLMLITGQSHTLHSPHNICTYMTSSSPWHLPWTCSWLHVRNGWGKKWDYVVNLQQKYVVWSGVESVLPGGVNFNRTLDLCTADPADNERPPLTWEVKKLQFWISIYIMRLWLALSWSLMMCNTVRYTCPFLHNVFITLQQSISFAHCAPALSFSLHICTTLHSVFWCYLCACKGCSWFLMCIMPLCCWTEFCVVKVIDQFCSVIRSVYMYSGVAFYMGLCSKHVA